MTVLESRPVTVKNRLYYGDNLDVLRVDGITRQGGNMKNVARSGWILVGVILGALATSWIAPTMSAQNDQTRLKVTRVSASLAQAVFIKDTKSTGCWFVVANAGVAMAPAEACQ
jgi:hypothetical protein